MSFETGTKNYGLPQYKGSDKPSWQTDITNAFEKLDEVIGDVADSAGGSATEITTIKGDISTLKTQSQENATNVTNLQTQVNTNNTEIHSEINALDVRVTTNKQTNDAQSTAISALQTQIDAIPDVEEIGTLTTDVAGLKTKVGDADIGDGKTLTGVVGGNDISSISDGTLTGAVNSLQADFGGMTFGVDADGNYGYYKVGADTVTPFKSALKIKRLATTGKLSTLDRGNDGRCTSAITVDVSQYKKITFGANTPTTIGNATSSITADDNIILNKQYIANEEVDITDYNTVIINITCTVPSGIGSAGATFGFALNDIEFS